MRKALLLIGLVFLTASAYMPSSIFGTDNTDTKKPVSATEEYELQERCSKRAEERFPKDFDYFHYAYVQRQ